MIGELGKASGLNEYLVGMFSKTKMKMDSIGEHLVNQKMR